MRWTQREGKVCLEVRGPEWDAHPATLFCGSKCVVAVLRAARCACA